MNKKQSLGFTLTELMITVAIIGILASIAVPSFQDMIERNRLKEAVEGLKSDLMFARTEAIKQSQDITVSRSTGNAGAWCYGLNGGGSCDCNTANACSLKVVSGGSYSNQINMSAAVTNNSTFSFRRGTIGANGVTFSTGNYSLRVLFNNVGRVRVCVPAGATSIGGYDACA